MITGKQNVLAWFDNAAEQGYWYWFLYVKGGTSSGNVLARFPDQEATAADARAKLISALALITVGNYELICADQPAKSLPGKGTMRTIIEVMRDERIGGVSEVVAVPAPVIQGIAPDEVQRMIAEALEKQEREREVKELREKTKQLEKDLKEEKNKDGFNRLAGVFADHAGTIIPMISGAIAGKVAGIPNIPNTQTVDIMPDEEEMVSEDENALLIDAVLKIKKARPGDWLELLQRVAAKVESNPGIVDSIKMFL